MSNRQDIAQKRAQRAFEVIKDKSGTYKKHVLKVPAMIRTNGLGNTLLFMKTGDREWYTLYKDVSDYLTNKFGLKNNDGVLEAIIELDDNDNKKLRALTQETLAFFNWLRRFSKE